MVTTTNDGGGADPGDELNGFGVAYDDLTAVATNAKGPIDVLDQAREDDMQTAFNDLVQRVGRTKGRVSALRDGPKSHTAPLKFKSG